MKLSDYVADFVANLGVKHVFLLPGGGSMHLVDSVGQHRKLKFVCTLHEQSAAIAADAYAQYHHDLGVALVTTGPGGTNTLTGVAGSWLDSVPLLILSGQVKRADLKHGTGARQIGFQEVDVVQMVKGITKYCVTVEDPSLIRFHLEKAIHLARSGRPGPVWIDIPLDVQAAEVKKNLRGFKPPRKAKVSPTQEAARAWEMIRAAKRPIVLAGHGVQLSGAEKELHQFLARTGIPVLATWKTIDLFPETHPYYVGRPGAIAQRGANFSQQNADLLLVLGARLDKGQTAYNHPNFAPRAKKIMVDIDRAEIKKMETKIHLPVVADAGDFLRACLASKKSPPVPEHSAWLQRCKAWQRKYPVRLPSYECEARVNDYVFLDVLSEEMRAGDLLIPGSSGACSERTMQAFKVKPGIRVFNSEGLGAMGFGIPMALGGCIASRKKRTVCIDGDGGFVMNVQELALVRALKLPIKFFILVNDGYASIRNSQNNYFRGRYVGSNPESGLHLPDYRALAKGFGIPAYRVRRNQDLRKVIRAVLQRPGPVICELFVSKTLVTAPRISNTQLPDGRMVSAPMEDLWPFLNREELAENMRV